jgi:hypothetical protein
VPPEILAAYRIEKYPDELLADEAITFREFADAILEEHPETIGTYFLV